ncbi:MAG: amylosucrase [Chitinophagaceae bacterium]
MYNYNLHQQINRSLQKGNIDLAGKDNLFFMRFVANAASIYSLYTELYEDHPNQAAVFEKLLQVIGTAYENRSSALKLNDELKVEQGNWFLSNEITGMSLYVDRFCGSLANLQEKLTYLQNLGVNLLHLMPLFESPPGASDGGYAVSDFRKVDERFGSLKDLRNLRQKMSSERMYLMLDIVLNHTSHDHEWAVRARNGDPVCQNYFYMYDDRSMPDRFEQAMPEIFPESAPGSFTYIKECDKYVMTVFHNYQWDLNFTNPAVFVDMLDNVFFYANLGVDILRIDAPAFIWKQAGTHCQNLPQAHTLLRLIRQCVQVAAPGMALLGEAIVAPAAIMKYFGTGSYTARECDFAYNATHMALQWDALATGNTKIMMTAQHELLQKPYGTSWITYTRSHDDIGMGYDDAMIRQSGFNPYDHRKFLQEYYTGKFAGSNARGELFSVNHKTQDARISGSLASLCGLEKALDEKDEGGTELAIRRILLMQAHCFFIGGIPMIFYGDEAGYTNNYSYRDEPGKHYDNRWMHRPVIDWKRNGRIKTNGTIEQRIYSSTQKLICIRKKLPVVADHKNLAWMALHNSHVAGYVRTLEGKRLFCVFNFSNETTHLNWFAFKEHGALPVRLFDHWEEREYVAGNDHEYLIIEPYTFYIMEVKE